MVGDLLFSGNTQLKPPTEYQILELIPIWPINGRKKFIPEQVISEVGLYVVSVDIGKPAVLLI
jgi:hypothetical protein